MRETTWIIDSQSGALTVEGLQQSELAQLATDLLARGKQVNCARPINIEPMRLSSAQAANGEPSLRVFRIYHNSVVEGPGRKSVNFRWAGAHCHPGPPKAHPSTG
jgi:hypothetical protein